MNIRMRALVIVPALLLAGCVVTTRPLITDVDVEGTLLYAAANRDFRIVVAENPFGVPTTALESRIALASQLVPATDPDSRSTMR